MTISSSLEARWEINLVRWRSQLICLIWTTKQVSSLTSRINLVCWCGCCCCCWGSGCRQKGVLCYSLMKSIEFWFRRGEKKKRKEKNVCASLLRLDVDVSTSLVYRRTRSREKREKENEQVMIWREEEKEKETQASKKERNQPTR